MVSPRVVFGRVVGQIVFTWFPEDELALGCVVFEPIESHVNGFGSFLFNCACEAATSGNIIIFLLSKGWG